MQDAELREMREGDSFAEEVGQKLLKSACLSGRPVGLSAFEQSREQNLPPPTQILQLNPQFALDIHPSANSHSTSQSSDFDNLST